MWLANTPRPKGTPLRVIVLNVQQALIRALSRPYLPKHVCRVALGPIYQAVEPLQFPHAQRAVQASILHRLALVLGVSVCPARQGLGPWNRVCRRETIASCVPWEHSRPR